MAKKDNTIFWVIGIIILLIVVTKLPLPGFPFAVITKTTCIDNTISYWDLDGNVLDSNNINNGIPENITYIPGKIGQAILFNGTTTSYVDFQAINTNVTIMWIKDYSTGDVDYSFVANLNGVNYVNGVESTSKQIIPIGPNFGSGFNGSVDEMATFTDLNVSEMLVIYNEGNARKVCYTTTYEENVSCKDFATEQVTPQTSGCLNYSGTFFPNCEYGWETTSGFYVPGSVCEKRFYCEDILSSDFSSLTLCQDSLITEEPTDDTITTPYTPPTETFKDKLNKEVFEIGGFGVKLIYLIIALMVVIALIYFMKNGKK